MRRAKQIGHFFVRLALQRQRIKRAVNRHAP